MAGDIHVEESLIVLPTAAPGSGIEAAVAEGEGRILHVYGDRVLIAALPAAAEQQLRGSVPDAVVAPASDQLSAARADGLTPTERLGIEAMALRQDATYAEAKAARPHAGADWDSGVADTPGCLLGPEPEAGAERADAAAPTSTRMTGTVAVAIVIVEGPTSDLKFSASERAKVVAEVQNGLGWLSGQSPQALTWRYEIKVVSLNVAPDASDDTLAEKEARWRDPAMDSLGYGPGLGGVRDYVEDVRDDLDTQWGYCAFFTKYPVGHFAYASLGGPRLVMHYENDGWGVDNIDRVFAHETGHIFGAPDEYSSSGCNCGGSWGYHGRPNGNCGNCATGGGVACIMKSNSWEMCAYTPYHFGFPLVDNRYSGIWRQGSGAYYLWANASWSNFRDKWQQLARQGLRLTDLEITRYGNTRRYSGVWKPGTGGYYLWVNASWASFRDKWQTLAAQGLRLVDIEVDRVGNQNRYSGVWLPGTGGYYLWVNASWASFRDKWQSLAGQGLRLVDLKIHEVNGQRRYSGVWLPGSGGYYLWVNASWASFRDKWQTLAAQGLRLVDLEVTNFNGQRRYSGVWLPGQDSYYLWANDDWQGFRDKWEELAGQGLRLIDLEITAPGDPAGSPPPVAGHQLVAAAADGGGSLPDPAVPSDAEEDDPTGQGGGSVKIDAKPEPVTFSAPERGTEGDDVAAGQGFGGGSSVGVATGRADDDAGFGGGSLAADGARALVDRATDGSTDTGTGFGGGSLVDGRPAGPDDGDAENGGGFGGGSAVNGDALAYQA